MGVILPAKTHRGVGDREQAVVGDGDAVSVAGQIVKDVFWSAEGGLGIDDPVLTAQTSQKLSELRAVPEHGCEPSVAELLATVQKLQSVDELAANVRRNAFTGRKKRWREPTQCW